LGRRSPVPITIDAISDRWTFTVEATLYFLAAEALTNAAKYGAQNVQLSVRVEPETADRMPRGEGSHAGSVVVCTVSDDGPGGADTARGTGLRGLRDRVTAVGGTFELVSPPAGGTVITGRIPVAQREDR
jgi:signal transduction histidine kinase